MATLASGPSSSTPEQSKSLTAFVSFPSPYTQTLLLQALVSTLPRLAVSLAPFPEDDPPSLQWCDYDLMSFDKPHANPTEYLISSYIYRKALIRKHQLHLTITEYLAKVQHRGLSSVLAEGGWPQGWNVEIQFADELDELWVDELYELGEALEANDALEEEEKRWFILKPGFADRAQGIRLFSTKDELQEIFEAFEPDSSDDESMAGPSSQVDAYREFKKQADEAIKAMTANSSRIRLDDSSDEDEESNNLNEVYEFSHDAGDDDEEDEGTGVMTSQLRHFVIQEYIPKPMLFDISQQANDPESAITGHKFHLRAYVLITGEYTVRLSRTMLALFSGSAYSTLKADGEIDLRPHLTNTCLQTDAFGAPSPPEELIKLFWELEGLNPLHSQKGGYAAESAITKKWLEDTFAKVGQVVAESVKAGAECGSFGLQFMPNAFEIFGVDLMLSFPESQDELAIPRVSLLEYNASPDFLQSGNKLRPQLMEMFQGVIHIAIKPFFKIEDETPQDDGAAWEVGDEKWGWRLVGRGEIRGPTAA